MIKDLEEYLDFLFPNPKCELNYTKDYEFLIAVVLSAQTTDKSVNKVTKVLFEKYDSVDKLKEADKEEIIEIIRPIGTFNKKSAFIKQISTTLVDKYNGVVPNDRKSLEALPGVGRKVANVVLSELFEVPSIAVDTHVSRVSKRLGIAKETDNVLTIEKKLMKVLNKANWSKRHHQLVLFGRYHCKAVKPLCNECKLKDKCKFNKQSHIFE